MMEKRSLMMYLKRVRDEIFYRQSGNVAIIFALVIVVLLGISALVVDVGGLFEERRELQKAADFASLAGVMELPGDPDSAISKASEYIDQNTTHASERNITVISIYVPNDAIRVEIANPNTELYFARIWGHQKSTVRAGATAVISSPTVYGHGVMPFGIMAKEPTSTSPFGYTFGEQVVLKVPSQSGKSGNFQFLDIIGDPEQQAGGAKDIYNALESGGAPNAVYKGEKYYTQTGINGIQVANKLQAWITCNHTFEEVCTDIDEEGFVTIENPGNEDPRCHRLIVCPIIINPEYPEGDPRRYNWSDVQGSKLVQIIDFAYFFVETWGSSGNDSYVIGRFVRTVDDDALEYGELSPWGPVVYRLIE